MSEQVVGVEIGQGNLILVNANYPLRTRKEHRQVVFDESYPGILLDAKVVNCLRWAFSEIDCGSRILPVSGFRTREEQVRIYEDSLLNNGIEFTNKYVALPDCSEHQTGLAIDLGLNEGMVDFIRPHFPYEGICELFRKKAIQYGFIERYNESKERITGISHEPWHFRYVGYPHSSVMAMNNLCLEEYVDYLRDFPYDGKHFIYENCGKRVEICFVSEEYMSEGLIQVGGDIVTDISGNNVDGFIMTIWRQ
ncbi:MAG TPA: D-alanyl-D-alanine carboxypeptidase family protein [Lachnospiraceae bacterium]|nr:D-alanyl-D-alanine carboxypeptidase family protein [Lachnospiraceae bacterium]